MTDYIITYFVVDPNDITFKRIVDHKVTVDSPSQLKDIDTPKFLRGTNHDILSIRTKQQFIEEVLDSLETQH